MWNSNKQMTVNESPQSGVILESLKKCKMSVRIFMSAYNDLLTALYYHNWICHHPYQWVSRTAMTICLVKMVLSLNCQRHKCTCFILEKKKK